MSRRRKSRHFAGHDRRFERSESRAHSPLINASFFARDHPVSCRSAEIASVTRSNHCEKTRRPGGATPCNHHGLRRCAKRRAIQDSSGSYRCSNCRRHKAGCKGRRLLSCGRPIVRHGRCASSFRRRWTKCRSTNRSHHRSSTSRSLLQPAQQIMTLVFDACSSSVRMASRCSGSPEITRCSQAPQMPSSHE